MVDLGPGEGSPAIPPAQHAFIVEGEGAPETSPSSSRRTSRARIAASSTHGIGRAASGAELRLVAAGRTASAPAASPRPTSGAEEQATVRPLLVGTCAPTESAANPALRREETARASARSVRVEPGGPAHMRPRPGQSGRDWAAPSLRHRRGPVRGRGWGSPIRALRRLGAGRPSKKATLVARPETA